MEKVIGIDLGTFNSCVAVMEGGTPVVIANRGGYKVTPSMVAITEAGKRLVGHIAKRQAVTNAENTVYAAKRLIGRKFDSPQVKNSMATCPYRAVPGRSVWSTMEAVGLNTEFIGGVLVARMLDGMKFALGPTIAARRETLERIGGFDAVKDYLAEDFVMGKLAGVPAAVVRGLEVRGPGSARELVMPPERNLFP